LTGEAVSKPTSHERTPLGDSHPSRNIDWLMKQGHSGSTVQLKGNLVEKISSDQTFIHSKERQKDLMVLSKKLSILPRIDRIDKQAIYMDFVDGGEGLTEQNARRAGKALQLLHEQSDYPHPCMTGLKWLIQIANDNLARMNYGQLIITEIETEYPSDVLIHSEPTQFIEKQDGSIVFIDFEGIGMGSRYQDLGFIYYSAVKQEKPEIYTTFLEGYQPPGQIEPLRVKKLAGITSLAYARFAEFEKRMQLGIRLLEETGQI
jgi:hypothetical protein